MRDVNSYQKSLTPHHVLDMPTACMTNLPIIKMCDNQEGVVCTNACSNSHATRLAELGLTNGEHIRMLRAGSPMLLAIGNSRISLRAEELTEVSVLCW